MAATSTEKSAYDTRFFISGDPEISDITRAILCDYSSVPEEKLVEHLRSVVGFVHLAVVRAWADHSPAR